jgi:hypothetical protein
VNDDIQNDSAHEHSNDHNGKKTRIHQKDNQGYLLTHETCAPPGSCFLADLSLPNEAIEVPEKSSRQSILAIEINPFPAKSQASLKLMPDRLLAASLLAMFNLEPSLPFQSPAKVVLADLVSQVFSQA